MQNELDIIQIITNRPGYLFKLQQIVESGMLDINGGTGEIHFDKDNNIRKIVVPKVSLYPQVDK